MAGSDGALRRLVGRGVVGGALMGMANLVPGISGGTMLLAAGVYPSFIEAIADLTRGRPTARGLTVLVSVVGAALLAILLGAGLLKDLVLEHRWAMYSLFIGLTLGGLPVVWGLTRERGAPLWAGAGVGFVAMAALALAQSAGAGASSGADAGRLLLGLGGLAGAAAMILPGVSGGYLLVVLGVYVPILEGIDQLKEALKAADPGAAIGPVVDVVLPVGVGVVVGVLGVSNLLRWLLHRFEQATLGVLLGLLVGAVVGLWPFQHPVPPMPGEVVRGVVLTAQTAAEVEPKNYPLRPFTPTAGQIAASGGLALGGFAITGAVAWIGRRKEEENEAAG